MIESTRDIIRHPVTVLTTALASASSLFSLPFIDPLFAVLWGNLAQLFTAASISAFTIAPNIDLPFAAAGEALQITAILLGVAYAGKLLYGVYQETTLKLD